MKKYSFFAVFVLLVFAIGCTNHKNVETTVPSSDTDSKEIEYMGAYTLVDKEFGTKTVVTINGETRTMVTNGLPNHKTGDFPNAGNPNGISAQNETYSFPVHPKYTGKSNWARQPGIALNGVKFEPETAEVLVCESGERYRIEAVQDWVSLGLDFNNAHVQPTGAYHYHGVPKELVKKLDTGEDLVLVGFAMDGFPIFYSKSGKYTSSYDKVTETRKGDNCAYSRPNKIIEKEMEGTTPDGTFVSDWEYVEGLGNLDPCNGIEIDGKYVYLLTDTYPFVGRCLMGEYEEPRGQGPPPRGRPSNGNRPPRPDENTNPHPHPHPH